MWMPKKIVKQARTIDIKEAATQILGTQLQLPGRLHSGDGFGHNGKVLENNRDMAGFGCFFTWSAEVSLPGMLDSLRAAVQQVGDDATAPTGMLDALVQAASAGAKRKAGGGQPAGPIVRGAVGGTERADPSPSGAAASGASAAVSSDGSASPAKRPRPASAAGAEDVEPPFQQALDREHLADLAVLALVEEEEERAADRDWLLQVTDTLLRLNAQRRVQVTVEMVVQAAKVALVCG